MTEPALVVFDLDGTLTRRDTMLPFLVSLCGAGAVVVAGLRDLPGLAAAALGRADRDAAKQRLLGRLLADIPAAHMTSAGERFAASGRYSFRPAVVELLRWHQGRGDAVVVVSAGLEVYVRPIVQRLGVELVAATRLAVQDGRLTGSFEGANVRGDEKLVRLQELISASSAPLVAYGDSTGDSQLLAAASHAVWCGRRTPLHTARLHLRGSHAAVLTALTERLSDLPPPQQD